MKLYQYISHFRDFARNKKTIQCNLETLKQWLQIEDKYPKPSELKKRILEPAMKELKEKADVWFDIAERVMDGRKMVGWKFNIYTPKKVVAYAKKEVVQDDKLIVIENKLQEVYGLSLGQARKVVKEAPKMELMRALYELSILKINGKIKNIGAYSVKFLSAKFDIKI